jgi:hypothetical protein
MSQTPEKISYERLIEVAIVRDDKPTRVAVSIHCSLEHLDGFLSLVELALKSGLAHATDNGIDRVHVNIFQDAFEDTVEEQPEEA